MKPVLIFALAFLLMSCVGKNSEPDAPVRPDTTVNPQPSDSILVIPYQQSVLLSAPDSVEAARTLLRLHYGDASYMAAEAEGRELIVSIDSLPDTIDWNRDEHQRIVATLECENTTGSVVYSKEAWVLYPPTHLQYGKQKVSDLSAQVQLSANGADAFVITYQGSLDRVKMCDTIREEYPELSLSIPDHEQFFQYTITAVNTTGSSEPQVFTIGAEDVRLVLSTMVGFTFIKYFLSHNGLRVYDVDVESVIIVDHPEGNEVMTSSAGIGQIIDTSSLPGPAIYYIVVTLANGQRSTQRFAKR